MRCAAGLSPTVKSLVTYSQIASWLLPSPAPPCRWRGFLGKVLEGWRQGSQKGALQQVAHHISLQMSAAESARPFAATQSVNQDANDALRKIEVRPCCAFPRKHSRVFIIATVNIEHNHLLFTGCTHIVTAIKPACQHGDYHSAICDAFKHFDRNARERLCIYISVNRLYFRINSTVAHTRAQI